MVVVLFVSVPQETFERSVIFKRRCVWTTAALWANSGLITAARESSCDQAVVVRNVVLILLYALVHTLGEWTKLNQNMLLFSAHVKVVNTECVGWRFLKREQLWEKKKVIHRSHFDSVWKLPSHSRWLYNVKSSRDRSAVEKYEQYVTVTYENQTSTAGFSEDYLLSDYNLVFFMLKISWISRFIEVQWVTEQHQSFLFLKKWSNIVFNS